LQNLNLEDWARWVRLGVYTKLHGTRGTIVFKAPFTALYELFKCHSMSDITTILLSFPHLILRNDQPALHIEIEFKNWHKYQVDSSAERVKRFRSKRNALEEKRSRREIEESNSVTFSPTSTAKEGPYV
jgi:hypothetical protein